MEIDNKKIIKITNRFNGSVGYTIKDLNNLSRVFSAGETKDVTMEELRKLAWQDGGRVLIKDYLIIHDEKALAEILGEVEPEYYYTEEDIKNLLLYGSLDALKDCLDFAPQGTIDLVKKIAVDLPLNDVAKRKAILDMTGFNVTSAIEINEETKEENVVEKKVRRTNEKEDEEILEKPAGRRVAVDINKFKVLDSDKYKVVNK